MAEEKLNEQHKKQKSPLIGATAQPTTLDDLSSNIGVDVNKELIDAIISAGLSGKLDASRLDEFTSISNARNQVYQLIDTMAADSSVSSILKTYAEEVCDVADNGHVVWCESTDPNISKFVNYLLNVMNVDKNSYAWVYCLLKYGDVYLKLYRESDYEDALFKKDSVDALDTAKKSLHESVSNDSLDESVRLVTHKLYDKYSYYVEMVSDPGTMFELTKYGKTYGYVETPYDDNTGLDYLNNYLGQNTTANNFTTYRMKSNDVNIYQADDYVHACLDDNFSRFPEKVKLFLNDNDFNTNTNAQLYTVKRGKSLLYDSYKVWREKSLLESAILLNRITKSSVVRNIQVEVGDMPKSQVQNTLRRIKELFEQKSAIDAGTGMVEYSNPGPIENNIYTATHNGQGAITVNSVGGDIEVKNLGDLDEWVNKFYAAYGIPKAFYGYTDDASGFNGGTSLAIISSVFAKSVRRVQNSYIQMLTDAINLFLINRGCKSYINNFTLKMKTPLTQEELDYRENLTNRINAISNLQSLFGDIESKPRRLKILAYLIESLNYGDEIISEIEDEIKSAKQQEKEEAEKAKADEELSASENNVDLGSEDLSSKEESTSNDTDLGLDLGNSSQAELPAEESFSINSSSSILTESPDFDYITEDSDLPSPEELDNNKDFTKNN